MNAKIAAKRGVLLAALGVGRFTRRREGGIARVLYYHSVSEHRRHEVNVTPAQFAAQMECLARHFQPVTLDALCGHLSEGAPLPERAVAVTFDDGYADNFTTALPILQRHNVPVTIFLTADYVGSDHLLPHDVDDAPQHNRLLSWEEVRAMSRRPQGARLPLITFGSHTATHARLAQLSSEEQRREIVGSKETIEERLGCAVHFISYPYGTREDFDERAQSLARQAGYRAGFSAVYSAVRRDSDRFALPRIGIERSDTLATFKAKLDGGLDVLTWKETPWGRRWVRRLNGLLRV